MTDFLHQVARKWYRLYWGFMLTSSLAVLFGSALVLFLPGLEQIGQTFALDTAALVLSALHVAYSLSLFWVVARRSLPFAAMAGAMLHSLILFNAFTVTDPSASMYIYMLPWLVNVAFNGTFGPPILLGGVLLGGVYVLLHYNFNLMDISLPSIVLLVATVAVAAAAYRFWRNRFVDVETQAVNRLSGMLRSNQQQSEILIQSIADGIIVVNTEGKITLMNPMAAAMTEWPIEEALNMDVQVVVHLDQETGAALSDELNPFSMVLAKRQRINQSLQLSGRNGNKRVISLVISPVTLPNELTPIGAVAVLRDISEQRAAEQQRAEFISTASHEMRTPVAAIEGYLALALNDKVSQIDSRAKGYLEKAHASTQHLGKLFQDLLTSSKAEDGRLTNHPTVVEMGVFMQQLADDLKFAAEKKGLLTEFVIGGADQTIDATTKDASTQHLLKPLYYAFADPDRMREVITNLFDNACKYTDQGKIVMGITGDSNIVQIYVRDTGAGIPPEDVGHLFQKFYRVDNSATRTIGGTGLGLFICRKIVELYHGRIWVESAVGRGSTFFINLPRLSTQKASEMQAADAAKEPPIPMPGTPAISS